MLEAVVVFVDHGRSTTMENNFGYIRIFAAWLVLWSHSYAIAPALEPLSAATGFLTGGRLAVDTFFIISGYVVTLSAQRWGLLEFCAARVLRIVPGMALVTVLTVLLGSAATTLTQSEYWSDPLTWNYFRNVVLFPIQFLLPGVFETLPNKGANGSLWTLPIEATMYILSAILLVLRVRSGWVFLAIAIAMFLAYFVGKWNFGLSWANRGPLILPAVFLFNFLAMGSLYCVGAAMAAVGQFKSNGYVALLAFSGLIALPWLGEYAELVYMLALPFAIHWLAFGIKIDRKPANDISYGIYLYAFPVQQTVVHLLGPQIGPTAVTVIATPPTIILALISWKLVEKPALGLKNMFPRKRSLVVHPSLS